MSAPESSDWLLNLSPSAEAAARARRRLFCFHYAGTGASMFESWAEALGEEIELIAVQLPGREDRFDEPFLSDIHQISAAVVESFAGLTPKPFAFFGHSIGALIGFDVARVLRRRHLPEPDLLVVSGQGAPQLRRKNVTVHRLPDDEFIEVLRGYGGTPAAVLDNEDLLEFLLPRLRCDIAISETYVYRHEEPLDCRIAAFYGTEDPLADEERASAWEEQSLGEFQLCRFPGNHFFLHTAEESVLQSLGSLLEPGAS